MYEIAAITTACHLRRRSSRTRGNELLILFHPPPRARRSPFMFPSLALSSEPLAGVKRSRAAAAAAPVLPEWATALMPSTSRCSDCGVVFSSPNKCKQHYASVHLGLKPFGCEHCAATFTQASSLKTHVSAVHLGLKPFECEHCQAAFTQAQHLQRHISAVHLGLKPHVCEHCAAASVAGRLKRHVFIMHTSADF